MTTQLHVFNAGYIGTNAYLLADPSRKEALLIDAPHEVWEDVAPLLEKLGCRLVALWLTHGHWDHTGDAARIQSDGVPVAAHEADRILIETPEIMAPLTPPEVSLRPARIDQVLEDGQELDILGMKAEVRHVPGHCPGNVLFHFPTLGAAFVGDAIFAGSIGRYDLPGGNFAVLEQSIRSRIYTLPPETKLLPGHGPATTVEAERKGNPFVRD
ncbi:MAG: MBL fold metallo-hydrolase [Puniceicoccaceae bacterium]|nr:MAG: MBL fold metallo-hydrolase [Puniceicoccaceae bacterium]